MFCLFWFVLCSGFVCLFCLCWFVFSDLVFAVYLCRSLTFAFDFIQARLIKFKELNTNPCMGVL